MNSKILKSIYFILAFGLILIVAKDDDRSSCKHLPSKCKFIKYRKISQTMKITKQGGGGVQKTNLWTISEDAISCDNEFDDKMLRGLEKAWDNCKWLQNTVIKVS